MFFALVLVFFAISSFTSAFRAVILPGFGNAQVDYINFVSILEKKGIIANVVDIDRYEWLNIAKGLFSPRFWTNECIPDDLFKFYFKKVNDTVIHTVKENNNEPVVLLCHSAGGWLARGLISDNMWGGSASKSSELVAGIVTLGSPHYPPSKGSDMTRGALKYVDDNFPGAWLIDELFYISVAGTAVKANPGITCSLRNVINTL
jgi:hypothetical protein